MATEALKSDVITNVVASTQTLNNPRSDCKQKLARGIVETTTAVTTGSTYRLLRLPSNAYVGSVKYRTDAMGGASAADIGLYYASNTATIGTVLDADCFGSAVSLVSALIVGTEITNEAGTAACGIEDLNTALWQMAGLTADPGGYFEVVATTTATVTAGGTLVVEVEYQV